MTTPQVPSATALGRATFGDQLRRNALRFRDRPAIIGTGTGLERRVLTYAELNSKANQFAHVLTAHGIGHGDVVAVMSRNCPELIVAFWGAAKIGVAVTGVNYTFTATELTYQLEHSGALAIICEDELTTKIDALAPQPPALRTRISIDAFSDTAGDSWQRLSQLLTDAPTSEPDSQATEHSLGILPYTSGTESLPKAVEVPQRNYFVSMIPSYTNGIGLVEDDVWYYTMPFHTIAGMGMQICLLSLGNTIVLPFDINPSEALRLFTDEGVTIVGQTPTFYLKIIQEPGFDEHDLSHIRRAISYGGTLPRAMFDAFAKVAPDLEWVTLWSQSELTQTPTIGRFRSLEEVPNQDPAWIGKPTGQLELRIVDESGNDAPEGEIICRSPGIMRGYHKDPDKTAAVLREGWLHTGDNARIDEDGNIFFVDRQKDLIKSGGLNVSSVEVERALYAHPAVLEAAVVGIADDYWGQAVNAFVVLRAGESTDQEAIREHCALTLASFKIPKLVHLVDALPKDTQGKILKRELRRQHGTSGA